MKRTFGVMDEIMFPDGKSKAFTLSYDDGTIHDRSLVDIMNRYGVKGTFNLNSGLFGVERKNIYLGSHVIDDSYIDEQEVCTLYKGHEVAGHGLYHASASDIGRPAYLYETINDKAVLERITGTLIRGYAYPYGAYNEDAKEILRLSGYHFARTVHATKGFSLPDNFLTWDPTCHHNDPELMRLAEEFVQTGALDLWKKLFYVWGHSYEFDRDGNWNTMETLLDFIAGYSDTVWFATNIEIFDYITAFRSLEYGADGNMVFNPSARTVWLRRGEQTVVIPPLETVNVTI